MNKIKLVIVVLCAYLLTAGLVSAQTGRVYIMPQKMVPEPAPVAGYSPNFAAPQPITGGGENGWPWLHEEANRLIRWEGWLDVDAFATSVLNQIKKQIAIGTIEVGTFTVVEPAIAAAVSNAIKEAKSNPDILEFVVNEKLNEDGCGDSFLCAESFDGSFICCIEPGKTIVTTKTVKDPCKPARNIKEEMVIPGKIHVKSYTDGDIDLYVWLYRHNFADTGLYQLYISAKGKMLIGEILIKVPVPPQPFDDIQSLVYEFDDARGTEKLAWCPVVADIEIWRGAVVRVNAAGKMVVVGNEAEVISPPDHHEPAPLSAWERAPSLINNRHYNPLKATGPKFEEPLNRRIVINENDVQVRTGSVQMEGRVRTINPYTYRAPQK